MVCKSINIKPMKRIIWIVRRDVRRHEISIVDWNEMCCTENCIYVNNSSVGPAAPSKTGANHPHASGLIWPISNAIEPMNISKSLCAGQHSPALDSCQSPSARSRLAIVVKHPIYYVELGDAMEVPYLLFYVTLKYSPELSILSITSMNPSHRHKMPQNGHNQFNIRYQNAMR